MSQPAGWYINPDGTASERFWDGARWTHDVRALPPPPEAIGSTTEFGGGLGDALGDGPGIPAAPADPAPPEPIRLDPVQPDPIQLDPIRAEPVQLDPLPIDPVPIDPAPIDPAPIDPVPRPPASGGPVATAGPGPAPGPADGTGDLGLIGRADEPRVETGPPPMPPGGIDQTIRVEGVPTRTEAPTATPPPGRVPSTSVGGSGQLGELFGLLGDLGFERSFTPASARAGYRIGAVAIVVVALLILIGGIQGGGAGAVITLLMAPLLAVLWLVSLRAVLQVAATRPLDDEPEPNPPAGD